MSKSSTKIVDLQKCNDGTYSTKPSNIKAITKSKNHPFGKLKVTTPTEADDFLGGIDAGLDFIDSVIPRVERFLRLRG